MLMRDIVLFKKGLNILDSVLFSLKKQMDEKHRSMQIASNKVAKAEKHLKDLEANVAPQITQLERKFKSDRSKMINYYNNSVKSHIPNNERDARVTSKDGSKFKRMATEDKKLIKVLKSRLESARKSVVNLKKKQENAAQAYNEAHAKYIARKDFIESAMPIKTESEALVEV